ncbi:MAG TPA: hypothetical protein ENH85_11285 [Candidatus Scalindua sp.]|nr:hypothetical protein [Candidatus Scalindua sp.]
MDCKHLIELNATTGKYDGEIDLDYCCDICDRSVPEESVVHITKTQHQLTQDVVKAGEKVIDGYKFIAYDAGGKRIMSCGTVEHQDMKLLYEKQKALDALSKDKT